LLAEDSEAQIEAIRANPKQSAAPAASRRLRVLKYHCALGGPG